MSQRTEGRRRQRIHGLFSRPNWTAAPYHLRKGTLCHLGFGLSFRYRSPNMSELEAHDIPVEVADGLSRVEKRLLSATYKPLLDYKICVDEDVIHDVALLVRNFAHPFQTPSNQHLTSYEVRATVVHFDEPAKIPIPPESRAIIVPVTWNDSARFAGQALTKGSYLVINKEEQVEPDFHALLFLFRPKP
ncbi:hypothetical protein N656DRAFT_107991 [Canariomyces notabilis]|uniref:Uncharacterized protein n=1 Tax=Canariomyces notabilis TaxID=2074819 RepID=A0AAN6YSN3_9PEZI|nr:hypothetical protein N656DRAFT_107991 [Canariomyces arenarius]